jgi:DNA repair exonuclease SbcCD nuclease subunit
VNFIGIGDLHFDKLDGLIVDCNAKIIKSLKRVIKYAREQGVRTIIQYGDVGDKTLLSYPAQIALYEFLLQEKLRDLEFHFVLGNHDFAENGVHSLQVLDTVSRLTTNNIKVYTTMEMVELEGRKFNMMPHPFKDFKREALNVAHLELANSYRDNGRMVDHGLRTKHAAVLGHLHTMHKVRRAHYSGTLYQTNFGESLPKSFHHVQYDDDDPYSIEVTNVPFEPPWKLLNLKVNTEDDLEQIESDPDVLYKLFVKEGVDLDMMDVMREHPNVVRSNKFKNNKELKELVEQEWDFEAGSMINMVDTREVLTDYLTNKAKLSKKEVKRSFHILDRITNRKKEEE